MIKKRDKYFANIQDFFLANQNVSSLEEINNWFIKSRNGDFFVDGLNQFEEILYRFKNEPIYIVGDYDVDGVMSTSEWMLCLEELGFTNIHFRIPKRHTEGYGINEKIIDEIENGLIITCDNGISAIDVIQKAKDKGLTVIITDHHLPLYDDENNVILPNADLIINPNAIENSADFSGYCGAGVVYKIIEKLLKNDRKKLGRYQVMAAIATICDVMELTSENYVIVKDGLNKMKYPYYCTVGLYALLQEFELTKHCTAKDIGYKIGPAINSMSRMYDDGATKVVNMLLETKPENFRKSVEDAKYIFETNKMRKNKTKEGMDLAEEIIKNNALYGEIPFVINIPNFSEGIIGILAGKIAEKYQVPTFVFTNSLSDNSVLKGSARTPDGITYHIKNHLDIADVKKELLSYGGHEKAGGLSVSINNFDSFTLALQMNSLDCVKEYFSEPCSIYDFEIDASQVKACLEEMKKYEPYGEGNPMPKFFIKNAQLLPSYTGWASFLGDGTIAKIKTKGFDAITFNNAEQIKNEICDLDKHNVNLVGFIGENFFNGECTLQIEFDDFEAFNIETPKTDLAKQLFEKASSH